MCPNVCQICAGFSGSKREKVAQNDTIKIITTYKSVIYKGYQVPGTGFEPAHPCERCDLNTVRLPISPPGLKTLQNVKITQFENGCKFASFILFTGIFLCKFLSCADIKVAQRIIQTRFFIGTFLAFAND